MRTAYDIGKEYAEFLKTLPDFAPDLGPVDVEKQCMGSPDIPTEDYTAMKEDGIDPDPREYWNGFNSVFE